MKTCWALYRCSEPNEDRLRQMWWGHEVDLLWQRRMGEAVSLSSPILFSPPSPFLTTYCALTPCRHFPALTSAEQCFLVDGCSPPLNLFLLNLVSIFKVYFHFSSFSFLAEKDRFPAYPLLEILQFAARPWPLKHSRHPKAMPLLLSLSPMVFSHRWELPMLCFDFSVKNLP